MITKILYTLLVIAVVFGVTRMRSGRAAPRARPPKQKPAPTPAKHKTVAYCIASGIAGLAALVYWHNWNQWHELVTIRVINSRTGDVVTYEAFRGDVQEQSFKTTAGWKVTVSEAERVEIKPAPGS